MRDKKIDYGQLRSVLIRLGFVADAPNGNRVVFRHPETQLPVILRRMREREVLEPINLLSVQNALANGGIVPKDRFDSLFQMEPLELWHAIIESEAAYHDRHGRTPTLLKLPVVQAYDLAKLRRKELGPLAERVMQEGIKAFEETGLLGIPVELVHEDGEFVFE